MTVITPESSTEPEKLRCSECDNDTFECLAVAISCGARIKAIKCAICGERTEFSPAPPEEFH